MAQRRLVELHWFELRRPSIGQADGRTALRSLLDTKLKLHVPRTLVLFSCLPTKWEAENLRPLVWRETRATRAAEAETNEALVTGGLAACCGHRTKQLFPKLTPISTYKGFLKL